MRLGEREGGEREGERGGNRERERGREGETLSQRELSRSSYRLASSTPPDPDGDLEIYRGTDRAGESEGEGARLRERERGRPERDQ